MIEDVPPAVLEDTSNASTDVDSIATSTDLAPLETTASPQSTAEVEPLEDEQALEWHEVIELQAFSERKAWIEEKIKFLESLPPIEVFAGLDAVRASAVEVPGLPSRVQLEEWVAEHDRIEKETEIFDSGELKKLKKFTKAATQRNLSPADTDLIELTLTTIYELDKLLHLLRDRSDNLDLLGIRLTWEERRIGAWTELRKVLSDIREFLKTRARWSPAVYDVPVIEDEATPGSLLKRRNSVVSIASMASDTSSSLSSPGFSRGVRFKLAELLSRDAAQFVSRVSSLKHTKIAGAGKTLDKLIDRSRKPVPDEFLDEQDKLEDEGINVMEDVGKYVMSVVMQWKKADELYVETVKDKAAAQTLLEELEVARLGHPTTRQDVAFSSRAAALVKRLQSRENPSPLSSSFPRPTHTLFPDQPDATDAAVTMLSSELTSAMEQVQKAEAIAKDYHTTLEAVKRVEGACKAASALSYQYDSLVERLQTGVPADRGDGSPPDMSTDACLDESCHAVFLSALPSILDELQRTDTRTVDLLPNARAAFLRLDHSGIDPQFKTDSAAEINRLAIAQQAAARIRQDIVARTRALDTARRVWMCMKQTFAESEELRCDVAVAIDKQMWRQQLQSSEAPPTPESPSTNLSPLTISPGSVLAKVDRMQVKLKQEVADPIMIVTPSVGAPLAEHLNQCSTALGTALDNLRRSARFWDVVRNQSAAMEGIRDDAQGLQVQMEDLKVRFDKDIEDVLSGSLSGDELLLTEGGLSSELKRCQDAVRSFNRALPRRVLFVGDTYALDLSRSSLQRHPLPISGFDLDILRRADLYDLPVDPASLDNVVRADSNGYSMLLSGAAKHLEQKSEHFQLVKAAKVVDLATSSILGNLRRVIEDVTAIRQSLADGASTSNSGHLDKLANDVHRLADIDGVEISRSFSPVRGLLHRLQSMSDSSDSGLRGGIIHSRQRALDDVESQYMSWKESVADLKKAISHAQDVQRILLEEHLRVETEQAAADVAEQQRLATDANSERASDSAQVLPDAEATCAVPKLETADGDVFIRSSGDVHGERAKDRLLETVAESEMESSIGRDGHELDLFSVVPRQASDSGILGSSELHERILVLRKRLRSIRINETARPSSHSSDLSLPRDDLRWEMNKSLADVAAEAKLLTHSDADGPQVMAELQSLFSELEASSEMMQTVHRLADFSISLRLCDEALSDLLEHIDSYPSPPLGMLSSQHVSNSALTPEEQLTARLAFTRKLVAKMESSYSAVAGDPRAVPERDRILQTWSELEAMGNDRVSGTKSRPGSVMSSGRSSRASGSSTASLPTKKKASSYGKLSIGSANGLLAPPSVGGRRSTSTSSTAAHSRSMSKASLISASRSVSGPTASPSSSLYGSTFASRQRTNSTTSNSSVKVPLRQPQLTPSRPRAQTGHASSTPRTASPALSDVSSLSVSRPGSHLSQSSTSRSSWARAPRQSLHAIPRSPPRTKGPAVVKKPYIANPKNKLDVAVGEVVNRLPVNINIELIADTWKDQSGKYWIGDQDPKLCFCRILRSQTVMVRVGGGWSELSKFIKDHFADAFRILPDSPRLGSREEKWINSTSLSQAAAFMTPPTVPKTPEPKDAFVPSFSLSTPSGASPKSIKSTSSPGSPLTPLQFLRRADIEMSSRPDTPSKSRPGIASVLNAPARQPAWRP